MIDFILIGLVSFPLLWVFFAFAIEAKSWALTKPKWVYYSFALFVGVPFLVCDFLFNVIYGTVLYLRWPDFKGAKGHFPLFTHRLRESLLHDSVDNYRWKLSYFICAYLLEPVDFGHCKLSDLRKKIDSQKEK